MPEMTGWCWKARKASSCVWMPLSMMGRCVWDRSQGRVLDQVRSAAVPAKRALPRPPPDEEDASLPLLLLDPSASFAD